MRLQDYIGRKYGKLTVLAGSRWPEARLQCECGAVCTAQLIRVIVGRKTNCGAQACRVRKNLVGRVFGRLTVVAISKRRGNHGHTLYETECLCGNKMIVRGSAMLAGESQSCGCLRRGLTRDRMRGWPRAAGGRLMPRGANPVCEAISR